MRASRRYRRQPPDAGEDLPKQVSRYGNLRHLQDQPPGVTSQPSPDLHQLLALGIAADYDGFDASVLTRFRQRLQAPGWGRAIVETTLARIEGLGLLANRRRRVDATHLVVPQGGMARLNQAEAVQEAIRLVVAEAYEQYPELRASFAFLLLYEAPGEERWIGGSRFDDERLLTLGRAGFQLLELLGERETKRKAVLAALLEQHFVRVEGEGFRPRGPVIRDDSEEGPDPLPRVHRVASLLKRWMLGAHQGAIRPSHLDYYLDEFTFRFNRRTSRSRGKLFYRLLQQAVALDPVPRRQLAGIPTPTTQQPESSA